MERETSSVVTVSFDLHPYICMCACVCSHWLLILDLILLAKDGCIVSKIDT